MELNPKVIIAINNKVLKIVLVNMKKYHLTKYVQEEIETKYTNYDVLKLKYVKYNMISFKSLCFRIFKEI